MNDSSKAYYSSEIEDFLTSRDLNIHDCTLMLEDIPKLNYNLDLIFKDRFFTIIYISNHQYGDKESIGHFTLLSHDKKSLEFFDPGGFMAPKIIYDLVDISKVDCFVNRVELQKPNTFTCPKWVIARILSLPTSIDKFQQIFKSNKKFSPDEIVDALYILKSNKKRDREE